MLLNISGIIVIIYTALCIVFVHQYRLLLVNMTGNVVAMTVGLISNLTIGVILGMIWRDNLVLSTGVSIAFCFMIGYLIGRPIHMLAVVEGIGGGIMGGVHGAMLGEMIPVAKWDAMLFIMDALFIAITALVIYIIHAQIDLEPNAEIAVQTHSNLDSTVLHTASLRRAPARFSFWVLYIILPVIILCAAAFIGHSPSIDQNPSSGHDMHSM
ncbi:hypothetical protein [Paenibacillus pini]|uniref:Uncharacterized protein n=1 Tax=Paenibacillus pini JCM 16418 TaxID=1236976 RepID=W7Z7K5_9BACL|nr:hypothetical protein [Paenibacillus pini]GAF10369.1 hypothetical protein JCM16418_4556 [Paenibacillus pini JCM 16418]